jgi:hypothetical protein
MWSTALSIYSFITNHYHYHWHAVPVPSSSNPLDPFPKDREQYLAKGHKKQYLGVLKEVNKTRKILDLPNTPRWSPSLKGAQVTRGCHHGPQKNYPPTIPPPRSCAGVLLPFTFSFTTSCCDIKIIGDRTMTVSVNLIWTCVLWDQEETEWRLPFQPPICIFKWDTFETVLIPNHFHIPVSLPH